jgi:hypothetical protein
MRRATGFMAKWWLAAVAITAFLVALGALAIAYPALEKTQQFATAGKAARARQCSLYGVGAKVYRDNLRRGVITAADLAKYTRLGPYCAAASKP